MVELRRARDIDVVVPYRDHAIAVVLAGGAVLYQCRNTRTSLRTLQPGDVIVTPAGEPKRWQHKEEVVGVVVRLAPAYFEEIKEEYAAEMESARLQDNFGTRDTRIEEIVLQLLKAIELDDGATRIYVASLKRELSLHLLTYYTKSEPATDEGSAQIPQYKMRRMIEYVDAHLADDLKLSDIAHALGMSSSHFRHAFRQAMGIAPHQYVLNRRIECAKSLLRDYDMPIKEVGQRIGCSNPSSFSSLFRRATGVTPGNYRSGKTRTSDSRKPRNCESLGSSPALQTSGKDKVDKPRAPSSRHGELI